MDGKPVVGRKPGLLDWLLTIIGINTTVVFEVYDNRVEYSYGSLSGRMTETIPLSKISNLMCGYFKPFFLLVLAAILFIAGICVSFSAGNGIPPRRNHRAGVHRLPARHSRHAFERSGCHL